MSSRYTAFLLPPDVRQALIDRFPPVYPALKADHITYRHGVEDFGDLFHPGKVEITGIADDGNGLQALVVRVDGAQYKPDGQPYHITWSLDPSRAAPKEYGTGGNYRAVLANDLVSRVLKNPAPGDSFTPVIPPLEIKTKASLIEKDNKGNATITPLPGNRDDSAPPRPQNDRKP